MRALELWERPQTVTQLRTFLGVCNYYHIYICNYAHLARPLQELLKVGKQEGKKGSRVKVNWQQVHQQSFDDPKKAVLNIRALNLYNPDAPFYLRCDARDWAVGCTLEQYDPKAKKNFPVAFWSKRLAPGQKKWSPREKEAYAIVEALRKYQTWIGNHPVASVTDHKSLDAWATEHLNTPSGPLGRRCRWHETFSRFALDVLYVPGKDNEVADAMSRWVYPASQAWSDVSRHGSLQDKLDNQVILAQDRADTSRCMCQVKGFPCLQDYVLSLPRPAPAPLQCEQCCPESLDPFLSVQCNACFISEVATRVQKKQRSAAVALTAAVLATAVVSCSGAASASDPDGPPAIPHATGLADGPSSCSTAAGSDGVHAPSPWSSVTGADGLQVRPPQCPSGQSGHAGQFAQPDIAVSSSATAPCVARPDIALSPPADLAPSPPVHIQDTLNVLLPPDFSANILWELWDVYYQQDKTFRGIYHALAHHTPLLSAFPEYRLRDGKLFYKSYCCVPEALQIPVSQAWHTDSVHAGAAALQADLKRRFLIDGLANKCKGVSRHCPVCQAAHAPNRVKEGMLLPHPVPDRVMSSVSLDTFHIGKAKGEDGRVYDGVVVCVDRLISRPA